MATEDDEFSDDVVVVEPGDIVTVAEDDDPPVEPEGDTVVIVENITEDNDSAESMPVTDADRWIELERWKTETEAALRQAADDAWEAKWQAQNAVAEVEATEDVIEEVVEATDDAIVDAVESAEVTEDEDGETVIDVKDSEPVSKRVHWLFRQNPFKSE